MKTIFVKYSTQRNDKYQIMTSILRDDEGKMTVRKEPVSPTSYHHLDQIHDNAVRISQQQQVFKMPGFVYADHIFETEYIKGNTLEEELYLLLVQKKYDEFEARWMDYKKLLEKMPQTLRNPSENECFRTIFGQTDQLFSCMELGHIDLITENIIRSADGTLWNIDPEWIFDAPIPIDFVLYRAVAIFHNKYYSFLLEKYSVEDLLDLLKIDVRKELFLQWENKFSQMIHNNSIYEIQKEYTIQIPDFDQWSLHIPSSFDSTLFFGTDGDFSEKRCIQSSFKRGQESRVSFSFSEPTLISTLRWDPCEGGVTILSSCRLELKLHNQVVSVLDLFETNALLLGDKYLFLTTDPQVIFSLPHQTTVDEVTVYAEVEIIDYQDIYAKVLAPVNQLIVTQTDEKNHLILTQTDEKNRLILTHINEKNRLDMELLNSQEQKRILQNEYQAFQKETAISLEHFIQVNNEHQRSADRIRNSSSWKITAPFRALYNLLRVLKNPLNARRTAEIVPVAAIQSTPSGNYQVAGEDPQFVVDGKFRKGIYLFSWDASSTRRIQLKMYPDYGRGCNEIDSHVLGYINEEFNHHERFLRFNHNVSRLRLDPGEKGPNTINLVNFNYVRLGGFSSIRIGIALIAKKTGFKKYRLLIHFIKLYLLGKKQEVSNHFVAALKDHGDGSLSLLFDDAYQQYIKECEPDEASLLEQINQSKLFPIQPLISIIVPVYNTNKEMLIEMIESVRNQTYGNWELCLADGHSTKEHVAVTLKEYAAKDSRVKIALLEENFGIAGNTNAALDLASGDYISLLDHDDLLPKWALYSVVKAINENDSPDILYSDEDKITFDAAQRFCPHFKPEWNPDLLRSCNYITHLFTARRDLVMRVGKFLPGYDGSQDHDLILRTTEQANKIVHIPEILYHWRSHSESTAQSQGNKPYTLEAGVRAITAHLNRVGYEGMVTYHPQYSFYTVNYKLTAEPLVSIIIPNYEHLVDLRRCLDSIYKLSTYKNIEIIIVENNSISKELFSFYHQIEKQHGVRVITWEGPFNFSAINNFATKQARGEMLLFLNNDTEVIAPDWIEQLLQYAQRKDVGAVGAKLYYPDDTIQHAGVILGLGSIAGHSFHRLPKEAPGYMARAMVAQDVTAVTAACLMMRRDLFERINGFDEKLEVAFNDVDLCMKIRQEGQLIVFNPHVELYHHESVSRGHEDTPEKKERFLSEIQYFSSKWGKELAAGDPYYNPHFDLERASFSISGK